MKTNQMCQVRSPGSDQTQQTGNLWITRGLLFCYILLALFQIQQIIKEGEYLFRGLTLAASLAGIFIHYRALAMIRDGQTHNAARWMIAANIGLPVILLLPHPANSLPAGLAGGLSAALIATRMLPESRTARGVYLSFCGASFLAVFGYLLPGSSGVDTGSPGFYLLLVLNLILLVLLLRPFNTYKPSVRLLLSMSLLSMLAVFCTFFMVFLVMQNKIAGNETQFMTLIEGIAVAGGAIFTVLNGGASFRIVRFFSTRDPLKPITRTINAIAETGDITLSFDSVQQEDETGNLRLALNELLSSFARLTEAAENISSANITTSIIPRSEQDKLAIALLQAGESHQRLTTIIDRSSKQLLSASGNLKMLVDNSSQMVNTINQAVQHILVSEEQSNGDSASFRQLVRAIESIARGAQEQAQAVSQAAGYVAQMGGFVNEVNLSMQVVTEQSLDTASSARTGVEKMDEMVEQIESIRSRVSHAAATVTEMGERSKQIDDITTSIESIASQTNLLALNTAIEAARSSAHTHTMAEKILDSTMEAQAWLIAQLLTNWTEEMKSEYYWVNLAKQCHVDNINITDDNGVVVFTNEIPKLGFQFSDDPKAQTYAFRQLIGKEGEVVCQPLQKRTVDDRKFKYVGVSRIDRPGIIQVGFDGTSIERYKSGGGVFSVISEQILQLANQTQMATKEIMDLNLNIQKTVNEAVSSMIEGEHEVDLGVTKAGHTRESLNTILEGADAVQQQIEQAGVSVSNMEQITQDLSEAMDSVSAVVEQNTAATEEMAASTDEVNESIQMISQLTTDMTHDIERISQATNSLSTIVENAETEMEHDR